VAQAQTETGSKAMIYGGTKVLIGEPHSGKGAFLALGYQFNENFIFWGKYDGEHNPEVDIDELKGSLSMITNPLVGKSVGLFFRGDIGGAYVKSGDDSNWELATFTDAGHYIDRDSEKKTRIWSGVGYHGIENVDRIYAVSIGVSISPKKWLW